MATELIGYARLIQTYKLPARPLAVAAIFDTATKGRRTISRGDTEKMRLDLKYRPEASLTGDLPFALRYLEVIAQSGARP